MGRDEGEAKTFGKRLARPPLPIQSGDRDGDSCLAECREPCECHAAKAVVKRTSEREEDFFNCGKKKRNPRSPEPVDELRQAPGPKRVIVVSVGGPLLTRGRPAILYLLKCVQLVG